MASGARDIYLLGKERLPEATKNLKRAVHLDSQNAMAWVNLGVAYSKAGDSNSARHCFERALHEDPRNHTAAENLRALDLSRPTSPP